MNLVPGSIDAFFRAYAAAFDALDGDAVAELYAVPSGIVSDSGYVHWPARAPIAENMRALCEQYRKKGLVSTRFAIDGFLAQGENFAIADVVWTVGWDRGQDAWSFHTTYNLMKTAGAWKVLLCTAYSETKLPTAS